MNATNNEAAGSTKVYMRCIRTRAKDMQDDPARRMQRSATEKGKRTAARERIGQRGHRTIVKLLDKPITHLIALVVASH